jgi:hypothetical protein
MKKMFKAVAAGAVLAAVILAGQGFARDSQALGVPEMAAEGATHMASFNWRDLTSTATNSATMVFTNAMPAKTIVDVVAAYLVTPFVDNATNAHNSLTLTVGDGTDADLFLKSMQLNSSGTEVFTKLGVAYDQTFTTQTLSSVVYAGGATTGDLAVVTSIHGGTDSPGQKAYTTAGSLVFTFTGSALYSMSELDAGEVRVFYRVLDSTKHKP